MTKHIPSASRETALENGAEAGAYARSLRILHWAMAIGFVLMWLTGIFVTNTAGMPYFMEEDRRGLIRDLHKSIGLSLLLLLMVRIWLRFSHATPPLPHSIPVFDRKIAHMGHIAIYLTIIITCITGLAIADLMGYGNAYFGIGLPPMVPKMERVAGWAPNPWAYVLHAVLAYGLLALVAVHVAAVWIHARRHDAELLHRVLPTPHGGQRRALIRLSVVAGVVFILVVVLAIRAFVTLGPREKPRDYVTTTPFFKR